jgi:uncharacterized protein DUF4399
MHATFDQPTGCRATAAAALLLSCIFAVGCGGAEAPPAERAAPAPSGPRVFFVQPQDGAMVKSPVKLEFGIADYQLAAVPPGATEARAGMGHHHVGVDTDCLPAGAEIPMASPWVHFGKANTTIDMQLPPGQHKLTLQLGNDLHRTIEGLCTTINVTVTE